MAAAAAPAVGIAAAASLSLGPVDDAFISLRYAANWAGGEGLAFHPGERVEGFTNFLWVALLAAAIRLGAPPEVALAALGWIALGALSGVVAWLAAARLFPGRVLVAAAAGVLLAANPVALCWAASGLESCGVAALALLALALAGGPRQPPRPVASAVALALAGMARPDAAVLAPVLWLAIRRAGGRTAALRFAAVFGIGFGAWFAARSLYFGALFPNTFYAKLDYGSALLARRGLAYVGQFLLSVPALALAAAIGALWVRRGPDWLRFAAAMVAVQLGVAVYEGGDHLPLFRFAVPSLAPMALLALHPFAALASRFPGRAAAQRACVTAALVLLAVSVLTAARARPAPHAPTELARFAHEAQLARGWSALGRHLSDLAPPGASLASIAIGALGYHSGLEIVDPHGMIDPVVARQPRALGRGLAGHEKWDVERVLARRPSYVLAYTLPARGPLDERTVRERVWGEFNAALVRDPRFGARYRLERVRAGGHTWHLHVRGDVPGLSDSAR